MWPFPTRKPIAATEAARDALGLTTAVAEALKTAPITPTTSDDVAAMPANHHLKMAERMVEKFAERQKALNDQINEEFETHRQNEAAELDNHRRTMAREAERHNLRIARLKSELEEAVALAAGYEGLRATLTPPAVTDEADPAPTGDFKPSDVAARKRNRRPVPTLIRNKGEDVQPIATE
jgi:hypothetical protein